MWPRLCEIALGAWLLLSPFVLKHPQHDTPLWVNDLAAGMAVILLASLSWHPSTRHAHVLSLAVSLWLIGFAFVRSGGPAPPSAQNQAVVGLLLLMFAILPNEASRPPLSWRRATGF